MELELSSSWNVGTGWNGAEMQRNMWGTARPGMVWNGFDLFCGPILIKTAPHILQQLDIVSQVRLPLKGFLWSFLEDGVDGWIRQLFLILKF